jgi:predicted Zn finger-like uncharacterized protein
VNVTCQECRSIFRVDPSKVPPSGVRARCSVCGAIMRVTVGTSPAGLAPAPTPARVTPLAVPTPARTATPVAAPTSAVMPPPVAPRPATPAVPLPPPSPATLVAAAPTAPVAAPAPTTATSSGSGRVINPFLRSDPQARAKRLARALVSDMVAYQPAKRAEGLANNSLKQLFRDEIRKSYDEYVEQVGREVAESTSYFQDALNDVLADGQKVF